MSLRFKTLILMMILAVAEIVVVAVSANGSMGAISVAAVVAVVMVAISGAMLGVWHQAPVDMLTEKLRSGKPGEVDTGTLPDELSALWRAVLQWKGSAEDHFHEVADAADRVKVIAGELVGGTEESSRGAENQRREADAVAQTIAEMAQTMHMVTGNANSAANAAREANREAQDGQKVVNSVTDAIHSLASEVERAASAMQTLEADTESIGAILEVIRGIADQTNLLALNAAIEAARAGEQGRGFAVVADEVRTLAQRTQQATQEIHEMIARLQTGSSNAVKVMDEGRRQAELSVDQANRAGASLETITQAVNSISRMNEEIAEAIQRQTASADTVNGRLGRIVQLADDSGKRTGQRAKLAGELGAAISELAQAMQKSAR